MIAVATLLFVLTSKPSTPVICIDPGHPSEVGRGTRGKNVTEIHVAWAVAKRMEAILTAEGVKVVLTKKSEDEFVKNHDRARIANESHADLLVRLHCDASAGTGFATYYPDRQGTAEGRTGPDLELLKRLAPIAKRFHESLHENLSPWLKDNGLLSDVKTAVGSRQKALTGSIFSEVPVVLVEMCVLTNPHDEALVSTEDGEKRLADALAKAALAAIQR